MTDETPAYILEDVTFAYGECVVLDVPRLDIPRGKVTALTGANGSGKTTLLHLLGFLERPRTGRVLFFGEEAAPGGALDFLRRVGLLLQDPYLFHTTVLANVEWGLKLRGVGHADRQKRAMRALEVVGLTRFAARGASELSGGESRRVALARVLALDADVLLLDEPMAHMDAESARRMKEVIAGLNRGRGITVVLASHDLLRAQALADNILSLHEGRIVPASLVNVLGGKVSDDGRSFKTARIQIYLGAAGGEGTHLAIDPAAIALSREPLTSSMRNTFPGRVVSVSEEAGNVRVRIDAAERFHVLITKRSLKMLDLHVGDNVHLSFKSTAAKVF